MILLADASYRAGGTPGLTVSRLAYAARARLVRDVLALIRCGNRIYEVTAATLGPLPLDQLPKSKPVTPYAVSFMVPKQTDIRQK